MKTVIVTGSQGFIGGYLCRELLNRGYRVIGIDNFSKYGYLKKDHDNHKNFSLIRWDLSQSWPYQVLADRDVLPDYIIAGAAMIGGISYFHKKAYDLLATNERIAGNTFDAAIHYWHNEKLNRIIAISSSMVFEGADEYNEHIDDIISKYSADCQGINSIQDTDLLPWPTKECYLDVLPSPLSTYGFQKLALEYYCKGAYEQYGVPWTIVRPFNCVGLGEEKALGDEEVYSGNIRLMMSHVLPDLINKVISGQNPLRILGDGSQIRCYTHGSDIARGIRLAMEKDRGQNTSFNISTSKQTTVLELAELIWKEFHGVDVPFQYICDEPFQYDVQKRIPSVDKATRLLGFSAQISLHDSVLEVMSHMVNRKHGV